MPRYKVSIKNSKQKWVLHDWEIDADSPDDAIKKATTHVATEIGDNSLHHGAVRDVAQQHGKRDDDLFVFDTNDRGQPTYVYAGKVIFRPGY